MSEDDGHDLATWHAELASIGAELREFRWHDGLRLPNLLELVVGDKVVSARRGWGSGPSLVFYTTTRPNRPWSAAIEVPIFIATQRRRPVRAIVHELVS